MPGKKRKFDVDRFVTSVKSHYKNWNPPVVTLVANRGASPFEVLVSTILSLRTKDEVTADASARLFGVARTPREILGLDPQKLQELIYPVGFYPTKARQLKEISRILIEQYDSQVPDDLDELLKFPGVGRKTANLVLVEGFGIEAVCVDTHVHRISNRLGYVKTKTPEQTEFALRKRLPRKHWTRYNELLVAFGQVICRPISPFCSKCPVEEMCPQIGVTRHR